MCSADILEMLINWTFVKTLCLHAIVKLELASG